MHALIIGSTGSGKSRLVRESILPAYRRKGVAALVLDPVCQSWGAAPPWIWQTDDPVAYLERAKRARRCVGIVDECSAHIGCDQRLARQCMWLATVSRNRGHMFYFLGQRLHHVPPSYRGQCSHGYLFNLTPDDAEAAVSHFNLSTSYALALTRLRPGLAYHVRPFTEPALVRVF